MTEQHTNQEKESLVTQYTPASSGITITLKPISNVLLKQIDVRVEKEFRESGEPIDVPKYSADLAGGGAEEYEYDEDSLHYPIELALQRCNGNAEEAQRLAAAETLRAMKLWEKYVDARNRMFQRVTEQRKRYILGAGVELESGVPEKWVEEQRAFEMFDIPDDPIDLKVFYILGGVLLTEVEQCEVVGQIMQKCATGIDATLVTGAMHFFRCFLEGKVPAAGASEQEGSGVLDDAPAQEGSENG